MAGQAVLVCGANSVTLPWWPDAIEWSELTASWNEQPRPGRAPLLLKEANRLPQITIDCIVASRSTTFVGDGGSVQSIVSTLRTMAASELPTQLMLAARDTGRWRLIEMQVNELDHDTDGNPVKVELSLSLKRAQDVAAAIGPIPPKKKKNRK